MPSSLTAYVAASLGHFALLLEPVLTDSDAVGCFILFVPLEFYMFPKRFDMLRHCWRFVPAPTRIVLAQSIRHRQSS
jgi:hypothetical protein